jgi:spermidine synthase
MKKKDFWIYENFPPDDPIVRTGLRAKRRLFSQRSPYQKIEVVDTYDYGRVLILDGIFQTSKEDEFIYHEMMAHLPLFYHASPQKVLIIGGGDGGVLREVLRHPIEKAYLVEIDKKVIEVAKKFLPFIPQRAFQDKRAEIIIGDGAKFVKEYRDFFDVVIIDSTDPIGPAKEGSFCSRILSGYF